jgi:hypothetical protein
MLQFTDQLLIRHAPEHIEILDIPLQLIMMAISTRAVGAYVSRA